MTEKEDGGAAFPTAKVIYDHEGYVAGVGPAGGMSLRDYFAGQALAGMGMWIPPFDGVDEDGRSIPNHMPRYQRLMREARAEWAYAQADAMLEARK